ncbi:hypothetical protein VKT23_009388 [Stygiomarasmius scandens]|uniref:Epidermal growth factor receptor-like transmembrane-juxtamembrane segment domain-containing protein n=1 Tax=Marasmiellus scandens TaxID=2682957 RepID=A0ABR1JI27_9AGAR
MDFQGYTIPPIGQDASGYDGPGEDKPCICSTVFFSLVTVCSYCQGGDMVTWPEFVVNCTTTVENALPSPIPIPPGSDFAIPHWAFLPLEGNGTINFTAIGLDNQPDVTISTFATTTNTSSAPSQSQTANNEGGGKGTNAGTIAGGVVGGVLGFSILAAVAFFVHRRLTQKKLASSIETGKIQRSTPPGWEEGSTLRTSQYLEKAPGSGRFYNPDDPSTFPPPVSAASSTSYNQSKAQSTSSAVSDVTSSKRGGFHPNLSVPEI